MKKSCITMVAATVISSAIMGQDSTRVLDPLVITANKFEQKQSTTGKVITVIGKDQIEKSAGRTITQLLNEQAGITINGAFNSPGSVQTVFMRGSNVGRTQILLDGIPVNDPSNITNDFDLNLFSINDVERIEICKGAQSTLYGSDAIAGVINIITVKKDIKKPINLKATSSFGNQNSSRNNLQLYGRAGKFTYTTRFARLSTNGFSSAYDSTGINNFDEDGYKGTALNASVQYQLNSALSLKTFIQHSGYKADVDASSFRDKRDFFIDNKNLFTGAGFNYKKSFLSVTGNYQYGQLERIYDDNYSIPGASAYSLTVFNGRTQFAELYGNINLGKGFSFLTGTDYRYSNMDNLYRSVSSFGPFDSDFPTQSMSIISAYGSLYYNKGAFNMEVGGRFNDHSRYGSNYTYTINPSFNLGGHHRLFASIATGFKAPSLYQLFAGVTETANNGPGNPDLKAETSVNYEIGIQQSYDLIEHRLVGFYRDVENGLDFDNNNFVYFNYTRQIIRGLEYEFSLRPFKGFVFSGNYTYLSPDDYTQNRENTKDTLYNYVLRRPNHSVNLSAGYNITPDFYISLSAKYISSRYDVGGYQRPDIKLADYTIFNAYASYLITEHIRIFADLQNFTEKRFYDLRGFNSIPLLAQGGVMVSL